MSNPLHIVTVYGETYTTIAMPLPAIGLVHLQKLAGLTAEHGVGNLVEVQTLEQWADTDRPAWPDNPLTDAQTAVLHMHIERAQRRRVAATAGTDNTAIGLFQQDTRGWSA